VLFKYLRFKNYRPYYGDQTIFFQSNEENSGPYRKNIVLFGGLNGAGKTSLINSIHICFYGRRKFGKKEYEEIRLNAINKKHMSQGGKASSIELGFQDEDENYAIEVTFKFDRYKNDIIESRTIYKLNPDGAKVRQVASSEHEFNEFIDQRIPIDVAPFFIFDAEKIRDLVGEHDKKETIDAIQKIVSLELYSKLLQDLNYISNQDTKNLEKVVKDEDIREKLAELGKVTDEYDQKKKDEESLSQLINDLQNQKEQLERERRQQIAQRSRTKQEINRVLGNKEEELKTIKKKIENFGRESLPKFILTPLIKELKERLNKEKAFLNAKSREKSAFSSFENFMEKVLKTDVFPPLLPNQKKKLYTQGKEIWADLNRLQQALISDDIEILHDLSQGDYTKLINYDVQMSTNIKTLMDKQYALLDEIKKHTQDLEDAPEEVDTVEEDGALNEVIERLGSSRKERSSLNTEILKLRDRQTNLRNEITRKKELQKDMGPIDKKIDAVNRYISATQEFIDEATILKAKQLKVEIESILKSLFRKSDFSKVEFSSKDFTLRIFNEYEEEIDLLSRSEGEKQLIALSMIWALTKVSGSNIPFVIDTPLARLDSIHRRNIVDYYFTNLSDQVIILSTDTEITEDFVESITPYVEKSYLLDYDDDEKITRIKEGYFNFEKVI
jgi:DNA sulfur modification protein DndD